jgi:hypothetical protein
MAYHRPEDAVRLKSEVLRQVKSVMEGCIYLPAEVDQVRIVCPAKQVPVAGTTNGTIFDAVLKEAATFSNLLGTQCRY